jgi:D-serine deaminase-like pyridoxal phosphate-dependent protein
MELFPDVETPAVLIDLDVLERNIVAMAERARAHGVHLRPHAKTHKVLEIGRRQIAAGAVGLTVAKTSEAEVFAAAGFRDLFIAYPVVGADKARKLLALSEGLRLAVGADSLEGARTLGGVFAGAGRRLDVMVKVDVGLHRVGVPPDQAVALATALAKEPGLQVRGIFTHGGHAYGGATPEAVAAVGRSEGDQLAETAERIRKAGLAIEEVSVGSTPTAAHAMTRTGVTECRPGNYVYCDASQVALGTCSLADCAMTVLATVVSVPAPDRAVIDAGSKTLSTDTLKPRVGGHGWILGSESRLDRLSEEHGVVAVAPGDAFVVGQRVRVLPNHACVVSNLHDAVLGVRGGRVETELKVAARGCVR